MKKILFPTFITASLLAVLCLLYGFLIEPNRLVRRDIVIDSPHYDGPEMRILLASDLHFGGHWMNADRAGEIFAQFANEDVDIVLLPGDFINGHDAEDYVSAKKREDIAASFSAMSKADIRAPVFATLGNHDSWYGKSEVADALVKAGVAVLDNRAHMLGEICILGLADFDTDNPAAANASACLPDVPVLVISHSPDAFTLAPKHAVLIVAGHTHGGQINLPFIGRRVTSTRLGEPYAYGLKYYDGNPVFITAGIGTSILPARFRAPPEYVVMTLR